MIQNDRRARSSGPDVLIVDDEDDIRELLELTLLRLGLASDGAATLAEARRLLAEKRYRLCLTDMRLPDGDGLELVRHIAENIGDLPVAVITAFGSMDNAVTALKAGAFDYLSKPVSIDQLRALVKSVFSVPAKEDAGRKDTSSLIGESQAMVQVRSLIEKLSRSQAPVFISGESGSGKERAARMIHELGPRAAAPFVAVNCGAIPENLVESELFGHVKGAFTGAVRDSAGMFTSAHQGTIFLDEIADLPLAMQVKLLRVLQEREVRPVGATRTHKVDVRVISACNRRLEDEIAAGRFREDLFYRLNVVGLTLPPLAERREDIALLANHFLDKLAHKYDKRLSGFAPEALKALTTAAWPGNVRQLYNVVEQVCALSTTPLVPLTLVQRALRTPSTQVLSFAEARQRFEREYLVGLLKMTDGNVADAARLAQRNRTEFYRLLQKHALTPGQFKQDAGDSDDVVDERHE